MIGEIFNNQDSGLDQLIESTLLDCHNVLLGQGIVSAEKDIHFSVAVVGKDEIRALNQKYRQKDEPTDVLSFLYDDDERELQGEIIVCPEVIRQNAEEDGIAFETELQKNLVHGFLHNLGYDHGEDMFSLQKQILANI